MTNIKQSSLTPVGNYFPIVDKIFPNLNQWRLEEEQYEKGCKPFIPFVSRQKKEDLPPSTIPGEVWFSQPHLYQFGDWLIEKEGFPAFSGQVIGIEWTEYDWEYILIELGVDVAFKEHELVKVNFEAVQSLVVYKHHGQWVFDFPLHGLEKEPFVSGIDTMIDRLTVLIPNAKDGFKLLFSHSRFPSFRCQLEWQSEEQGGNWYHCPQFDMKGWLCPALFSFFNEAPSTIYVKAEALE